MADEILIKYKTDVSDLKKGMGEVRAELNQTGEAEKKYQKEVIDTAAIRKKALQDEIDDLKELKQRRKEALNADEARGFDKAISDAQKNIKALSSDMDGVADKAKGAFSALRTVANILPGIGISGLVLAGYEVLSTLISDIVKGTKESIKSMEDFNKIMDAQLKTVNSLHDNWQKTWIDYQVNAKNMGKTEGEIAKLRIDAANKVKESDEKLLADRKQIIEDLKKDAEGYTTTTDKKFKLAELASKKLVEREKLAAVERKEIENQLNLSIANLRIESAQKEEAESKKRIEKMLNEKEKGAVKEKKIVDNTWNEAIREAERQGQIEADIAEKFQKERLKQIEELNKLKEKARQQDLKSEEAAIDAMIKAYAKMEKAKEQLNKQELKTAIDIYNSIVDINNQKTQTEIDNITSTHEAQIQSLDDQLKRKVITQEEYDKRKAELDKKAYNEERDLKIKAFNANKQASEVNTIINTAQAIVKALADVPYPYNIAISALMAAQGAAQLAVIEAQPTPKFEKGGKVKGERHYAGGTLIEAEKDEWIIKRDESIKHDKLLNAINSGKGEDYIYNQFVVPALKQQLKKVAEQKDKSFADNLSKSMMFNFKDENLLDSLKQSRKNDKQIAMYLVKELKQGNVSSRKW